VCKRASDLRKLVGQENYYDAVCSRFYVARAGVQVFGHYNPYGNLVVRLRHPQGEH
jgi:hypothetical protein